MLEFGSPARLVGRGLIVAVVLCSATVSSPGSERSLAKLHQEVLLGETALAEFTLISTLDSQSPYISKYLYQDAMGKRLVVSWVAYEGAEPNTITVKFPATGEILTIVQDADNSSTITLGSAAPIVVLGSDVMNKTALPEPLKVQGAQALDTISVDFRKALRDLCAVGSFHAEEFSFVGAYLNGLFFTQFEGKVAGVNSTGPITGAVKDFDPNSHPPGEFELAFGDEYFSLP